LIWINSTIFSEPIMGKLLVRDIDVGHIHQVLEPISASKPETAGRVRGRIEKILGWAKVNNYRGGENPARWRDNLDQLLPKLSEVRKVKHHPALPYAELPAFMEKHLLNRDEGRRVLPSTSPSSRSYPVDATGGLLWKPHVAEIIAGRAVWLIFLAGRHPAFW
jgi:hypothetical protein